jgi:hypothetical protein
MKCALGECAKGGCTPSIHVLKPCGVLQIHQLVPQTMCTREWCPREVCKSSYQ